MELTYTHPIDAVEELWNIVPKIDPDFKRNIIFLKCFYTLLIILGFVALLFYDETYLYIFEKENRDILIGALVLMSFSILLLNLYVIDKIVKNSNKKRAKYFSKNFFNLFDITTLILEDNKLILSSNGIKCELPVSIIEIVIEHKNYIYIFQNPNSIIDIIPLEVFKSQEEKDLFLNLLKSKPNNI